MAGLRDGRSRGLLGVSERNSRTQFAVVLKTSRDGHTHAYETRFCEAAMHAFAAENPSRMEAMSSASRNIDRTLLELKQRENQVRQEEVTAEIVELACDSEISRI